MNLTAQFKVILIIVCLVIFAGCKKDEDSGSCSDGIKNQDETGIDCGGSCSACATCSDGVQNQGETDIDCGGPCSVCQESLIADMDGNAWAATSIYPTNYNPYLNIIAQGSVPLGSAIVLNIPASSSTGTYTLAAGTSFRTSSFAYDAYETNVSGTATITKFDTTNKLVSGTFSFTAEKSDGTSGSITNGVFVNISYL